MQILHKHKLIEQVSMLMDLQEKRDLSLLWLHKERMSVHKKQGICALILCNNNKRKGKCITNFVKWNIIRRVLDFLIF